ncbi:MAG: NAD(P)/FAD-dependent oxidoreductase [Rhodanobacteraceae bacterium]
MIREVFDIAVIGGGIAGATAAASLAVDLKVVLLERESQPGYHATGRSAALFMETYGNGPVRALTRASRGLLFDPPAGFSEAPLTLPRGALYVANHRQLDALHAFAALPDVARHTRRVDSREACKLSPSLRADHVAAALYEPDARDIDVHALHQGYLRQLRVRGGRLVTAAAVSALRHDCDAWAISTGAGAFTANVVVDAAGAWADEVAGLAGLRPIGIQPLRRTAFMIDAPPGARVEKWPVTIDIDERFYFKPESGGLLLSPADETPSPPCDVQPDDLDIALAVDRVERATTLPITHVSRKWAGLRTFVPDRTPVIGYDARTADFFWLAALGGYGVQTSPAVGQLAASLIRRDPVPPSLVGCGLDVQTLSPTRLDRDRANVQGCG